MAIVTPRRSGSVNFVITQDIANVPTEIKISKVETIYKGSFVCRCEQNECEQTDKHRRLVQQFNCRLSYLEDFLLYIQEGHYFQWLIPRYHIPSVC